MDRSLSSFGAAVAISIAKEGTVSPHVGTQMFLLATNLSCGGDSQNFISIVEDQQLWRWNLYRIIFLGKNAVNQIFPCLL